MRKAISIGLATLFFLSVFSAMVQCTLASAESEHADSLPADSSLQQATTIFVEDFDAPWYPTGPWRRSDDQTLNGLDYWDDVDYRSYSGYWSGWCAGVGSQEDTGQPNYEVHQYDDYMMARMWRSVGLSGYTSVALSYYYWIDCEYGYDYLQVMCFESHDATWHYLDQHTGNSGGWQYSSISIPTDTLYVGFYFYSDSSVHNREGAYIDHIVCTGYRPPSLSFSDGFESGSFSRWSGTYRTYGETTSVVYYSIRRTGYFSARFTSNGGYGYEKAYCYKNIPAASNIYVRGYFYVAQSGIGDRFFFIVLKPVGTTGAAYVGLKRNPATGLVSWAFNCRNGASYPQPDIFSTYLSPHAGHWYCVELHWKMGVSNGYAEVWINGIRIGRTGYRNTAYYGGINQVQIGLPQVYNCGPTRVYADNLRMQNAYIGP